MSAIFADLSALQILVMALGLGMASLARGYSGFGFSALLVASWSLVGAPSQAVAVTLVLEVVASIVQAASVWRDVPWKRVGALLMGAVVGVPAGVLVLAHVAPNGIRVGLAVFVLVAAGLMLAGWKRQRQRRSGPAGVAAVGVVSGIANGAVGMGGLPVALFLTAEGDSPRAIRAAAIAYFFLLDSGSFAMLASQGLVAAPTLGLAAASFPILLLGMWIGEKHFHVTTPEVFRRVTLCLLVLLAVLVLLRALA